jgi:hypothetical protein
LTYPADCSAVIVIRDGATVEYVPAAMLRSPTKSYPQGGRECTTMSDNRTDNETMMWAEVADIGSEV